MLDLGMEELTVLGLTGEPVAVLCDRRTARPGASCLQQGTSVILDASWSSAARRSAARALAGECAAELVELRCECPSDVVIGRLQRRARRGDDVSGATPGVARSMNAAFDSWPEAEAVDTAVGPDETLETASRALARGLDAGIQRAP
jgi:hypothetical protein